MAKQYLFLQMKLNLAGSMKRFLLPSIWKEERPGDLAPSPIRLWRSSSSSEEDALSIAPLRRRSVNQGMGREFMISIRIHDLSVEESDYLPDPDPLMRFANP
nr:hypothetical protein Itr_chr09CG07120 [Ipomoea trifida]